jgi:cell division protease FtsH
MALGYTMRLPIEDRYLIGREELLDDITAALGGRAAEEMIFNDVTTGESDDLVVSTEIARRMVTEFGMSEQIGPVSLTKHQHPPFLGRDIMEDRSYSEQMAESIDREVRRIVDECYLRAKQILSERREEMDRVVKVLLEKETLERSEFRELMGLPPEPTTTTEGPQPPESMPATPESAKPSLPDQGAAPQTA